MTDCPIKGNQTRKVEIDMGKVNCVGEPYVICVNGKELIFRYYNKTVDGFGKITLESLADDA